ncbi:monovalent cation/H+ antiporter subunit D [Luteimonas aestuarii]|uniref:Monovalent cation/H+ antiporter subunit D n=1 Tax=Luteimonas aestuarii TaxID=453837 RepID=A0A4R5TTX2_9GAMM|nr:monovalent cation/H+ antiporter subunit D [Luteimonas aestuarii]TDK24473.1 monovalent cation/H+ antiporter subunit D [Luteimonas aestuarii]
MQHLILAPVLVPLLAGSILLLLERSHSIVVQRNGAWLGIALLLAASLALFARAATGEVDVYLLGDWPSRLGIVLMADRLSALMVLTTSLLAIPALMYACAGWDRRALHFHALFQIQLAGLNGAFLTGDIFNLFVFFEVLLIASYGLLLSGGRGERMAAGMHYVVFNIAASTLFLIALAFLYGLLGTLNMAEIAVRIREVPPQDLAMVRAAAGLLLVVFCAKAALLPMYLWLPDTYARAPAAVAALFTIMTKVGLYAMLRVTTLVFGEDAGALAGFGRDVLLAFGLVTLVLGGLGVVGALRLRIGAAYLVLVSAGTLFVAFALGEPGTISAGLYYLPHSCFAGAAMFLIAHIVQRERGAVGDRLLDPAPPMPRLTGMLYMVAAISLIGLPPLSGFIGKFVLLEATPSDDTAWVYAAVLGASLLVLIGLSRTGTRLFWRTEAAAEAEDGDARDVAAAAGESPAPVRKVRGIEIAATLLLLAFGVAMTVAAAPILRYTQATAEQLLSPGDYIRHVQDAVPSLREP